MTARARTRIWGLTLALCTGLANPASADDQPTRPTQPPRTARRIGVQGFGLAGVGWPAAKESFEAAGLGKTTVELGGGVQVTDIWRNLFVEVSATRWSNTGERAFIDDEGNRFPLGIPLSVKTTHLDVSLGWRVYGNGVTTYLGGGAGSADYVEESPFALSGDDLATRATSYHVLFGVEVPLQRWLAVAGDFRYRFVPDVLGDDGISGVLEEDRFGGPQLAIGLRIGFGGTRPSREKRPPAAPPAPAPADPFPGSAAARQADRGMGVMIQAAPVFLLPDSTRTPLRTLETGTSVRLLEESGEWIRVEFHDFQFGARQGYVQRKFVRVIQ